MNHLPKKLSMRAQLLDAMKIDGEPLDGSGFEKETPEERFSGDVLVPLTSQPVQSKASHLAPFR